MRCKNSNNTFYTATWARYYPDCRQRYFFCNAGMSAFLPAITVCYQNLIVAMAPALSTTF
jgi:hypothetical protein